MKITIMVMDVFVRFRMVAIQQMGNQTHAWEKEVMCLQDVTEVLVGLGFMDPEAATRLVNASTTITPQAGLQTVPVSDLVDLVEYVYSDYEPSSPEVREGHALIASGETTENSLASAGLWSASKVRCNDAAWRRSAPRELRRAKKRTLN